MHENVLYLVIVMKSLILVLNQNKKLGFLILQKLLKILLLCRMNLLMHTLTGSETTLITNVVAFKLVIVL